MSGKIRSKIPQIYKSITKNLEQYETDLTNKLYEYQNEDKETCEKVYQKSKKDIQKIQTLFDKLYQYNHEWNKLIKKKNGEEKEAEREAQASFYQKYNVKIILANSDAILDSLKELNLEAKRNLKRFDNNLEDPDSEIETDQEQEITSDEEPEHIQLKQNHSVSSSHTLTPITPADSSLNEDSKFSNINVKLPTLSLIHFNGREWQTFWDDYNSTIHNNNQLEPIQKFKYLKGLLHNEPYRLIAPYPLTNANYNIVIELLKKRYGNPEIQRENLHTELRNLRKTTDNPQELRKFLLYVNRIVLQLQTFEEDINHPQIRQAIETKLPLHLRLKIYKIRQETGYISTEDILELVDNHTQAREEIEKMESFKKENRFTNDKNKFQKFQNFQSRNQKYVNQNQNRNNWNKQNYGNQSQPQNPFNTTAMLTNANVSKSNNQNQTKNYQTKNYQKSNYQKYDNTTKFCFCAFCQKGDHQTKDCKTFTTPEQRIKRAIELALCLNCLKKGHQTKNCNSKYNCFNCKNKHHTLLCKNKSKIPEKTQTNLITQQNNEEIELTQTNACLIKPDKTSEEDELFMTIEAFIHNPESEENTRALILFDNASQKSYITEELALLLNLSTVNENYLGIKTFNNENIKTVKSRKVETGIETKNGEIIVVNLQTIQKITDLLTTQQNVNLFKPNLFVHKSQPDILIGIDHYWQFMKPDAKMETLPSGFHMIDTKFGNIVSGKGKITITQTNLTKIEENESLNKEIQQFWNLENIGIIDNPYVDDNETAINHFNQNIKFENKRYTVKWPFKQNNPDLPTNFGLCFGRLKNTIRKLKSNELLEKYNNVFTEQLQTNIIEKVDMKTDQLTHYLPHQPVLKENSNTTKLRIVFDASAKMKGKNSLNDIIFQGPTLLPDLLGLILRFRLKKYVLLADLEKAFLQLNLDESVRDTTRFLWLKDETISKIPSSNKEITFNDLQIYRFARMPFGVNASPFLLNATIQYHLSNEQLLNKTFEKYHNISTYPATSKEAEKEKFFKLVNDLKKNGYVDNFLMFTDTQSDLLFFQFWSKQIFKEASMNLREFTTNDNTTNEILNQLENTKSTNISKILGIKWDIKEDILIIPLNIPMMNEKNTKRDVLKAIAKNYDPMGWISPVILTFKNYFQELWKDKTKWDDKLTNEQIKKWNTISKNETFEIPRYQINKETAEIHIFADASDMAYAAVAYIKIDDQITLIFSKTRLNPIKSLTIPRLELLALLISMRILKFLKNELNIKITNHHIWSDSQCVLSWLKTTKELPRFINNRIKEIKKINDQYDCEFHYLKSNDNPADIASRGISADELKHNQLWWNGPDWLHLTEEEWPQTNFPNIIINEIIETSVNLLKTKSNENVSNTPKLFDWKRFSSWTKLIFTLTIIMKFLTKTLNKSKLFQNKFKEYKKFVINKTTTIQKLNAEKLLIKIIQNESKPKTDEIKQLGIKENSSGILICTGRLKNACINPYPIFLPKNHHCTELIIQDIHENNNHCGTATTLAELRKTYWLPKGRRIVDKVRKNCFYCKRYLAQPYALPIMPDLPKSRVQPASPFQITGLDYMGPIKIKEPYEKIWIILFTCFVTRGIHLELVTTLSTEHFLNAFRRFISRKGTPKHIWSDNASQLKHASQIIPNTMSLKEIFSDDTLTHYFMKRNIQWHFTTEYAPWKGGCYERLNQCVKSSMRKTIGKKLLNYESFNTLLCETESLINSRPLTFIYDDINSPQILRPIDFLLPNQSICIPPILEIEEIDDPTYLPKITSKEYTIELWKNSTKLLDKFWQYWSDEYINSLRERFQINHKNSKYSIHNNPKLNEIVIIKEENLPRSMWKLGKIIELSTSDDNIIRGVTIQLPNKNEIKRPLNHIYPLEINSYKEEDETNPTKTIKTNTNLITVSIPKTKSFISLEFPFILTLLLMLLNTTYCTPYDCSKNMKNYETLFTTFCVKEGFQIKQNRSNKLLCYDELSCSNNHIRYNIYPFCGSECKCPNWAKYCTFYKPKSDPEFQKSISYLMTFYLYIYKNNVKICSFNKSDNCPMAVKRHFNTILLYDNSIHLIKRMAIQHVQIRNKTDFSCIGEGNLTIGTPSFCRENHCDKNGTRFCFYELHEIIYLVLNDTKKIPIKAYGRVERTVYTKPFTNSLKYLSINTNHTTNITKRSKRETDNKGKPNTEIENKLLVDCVKGGIIINSIDEVEIIGICSKTYCVTIHTPQIQETILFPSKIVINQYDVNIKLMKNNQIQGEKNVQCGASPYCEMITCRVCLEYLRNPQCVEQLHWALIVTIGLTVLYCISVSLTILKISLRILFWIWSKIKCKKYKKKIQITKPNKSTKSNISLKSYKISTLIIFFLTIKFTQTCDQITSLTAGSTSCSIEKDMLQCSFDQTTLISIKPELVTCLKLEDVRTNTSLNTIEFQISDFGINCEENSNYFMRNYDIDSDSNKRCPSAGHCTGNECETLQSDQRNPELSDSVNDLPGYSYCAPSCGGWHCSCFLATDGCLFYRTYIEPTDETDIYELIKCNSFNIEAQVKITDNANKKGWETTKLSPGAMVDKENIQVTLTSSTIPPTPLFGSKFIINRSQNTAIIVDNEELLRKSISCSTRDDAEKFNCKVPQDACQCTAGDTMANCDCTQDPLPDMFTSDENKIPLTTKGAEIKFEENKIKAKLQQTTAVQFQITFKGYKVVTIYDKSKCNMTANSLTGCFACTTGAKLQYNCKTDYGSVHAQIKCPSQEFTVPCNSEGIEDSVKINFGIDTIEEKCEVVCPGGKSEILIKGNLNYISEQTEKREQTKGNSEQPHNGYNFDNIINTIKDTGGFFLDIIKTNLRNILVILPIVIIFGLLFIYLFPIIYPAFLKCCCTCLTTKMPRKTPNFGGNVAMREKRGHNFTRKNSSLSKQRKTK
jgi:hypothetical protein